MNGRPRRMRELSQRRTIPPVRATIAAAEKELSAEERQQVENNLKQMGGPQIRPPYNRLPAELQARRLWVSAQPRHYTADSYPYFAEEFAAVYAARQKQEFPLGDAPLVVLLQKPGYGNPPPDVSAEEWKQINEEKRQQKVEFTKLSRNSKLIVAENSGHHIQLDEPAVVTNAIQQAVESARRRTKLLP